MKLKTVTFLLAILASSAAFADVTVADPWVRATVPHQKATGAFMRVTSTDDARLVEVRSPVAGVAEIHEMRMENEVMKMRRVSGLDLPAGKEVALKPGGWHVMLIGLEGQVKEGGEVPLTLVVESKDGKRETIEVIAPVRPLKSGAGAHMQKH